MSTAPATQIATKTTASKKAYRVLTVTGVYPTDKSPHQGTFIKSQVDSLIAEGLEVEVIHPEPGPAPLRYIKATVGVFIKTLTGRFDIVHGHYGLWCLAARMQWTTPVVASFLGDDLLGTVTGGEEHSAKGALVVSISRWLTRRVDTVIVKSERMKKVVPAGGAVFVIPNGVDFELFRPTPRAEARAALGWDMNRNYVLFCNDPEIPVKNFSLAQAAIACLRVRGVPAELVVACGVPQAKVVQYMNASNVLILPSIAEGSPNVVKEAMACNIPVVASDVGDVTEVIGRTRGCRICPLDPDVFAAALEGALQCTGPTSGRDDIGHLERSVIAKQVIRAYDRAVNERVKGRKPTRFRGSRLS